jgi:hypothetical protein
MPIGQVPSVSVECCSYSSKTKIRSGVQGISLSFQVAKGCTTTKSVFVVTGCIDLIGSCLLECASSSVVPLLKYDFCNAVYERRIGPCGSGSSDVAFLDPTSSWGLRELQSGLRLLSPRWMSLLPWRCHVLQQQWAHQC